MEIQPTVVTGTFLVAGALMYWLGWILLPHKVSHFFKADDFVAVGPRVTLWLWIYRVHLFGHLVIVMAMAALATLFTADPRGSLVWPAAFVLGAGMVVGCLAKAWYYHYAVWGGLEVQGRPADEGVAEARRLAERLDLTTHYVTCLTRFGRVFFGLGQVVLAAGLWGGAVLPDWWALAAAILGVAAMALTMLLPDHLHLFRPVFHLNTLWLVAGGAVLLGLV